MARLRCDNQSEIPGESSGMDGELSVRPGLHYTTATTTPSLALNGRNFGDVIAPASERPQIIRVIARATGRTVTG